MTKTSTFSSEPHSSIQPPTFQGAEGGTYVYTALYTLTRHPKTESPVTGKTKNEIRTFGGGRRFSSRKSRKIQKNPERWTKIPLLLGRCVDPTRPCWRDLSPFGSLCSTPKALHTETKVESGTSQSKSGSSLNLSNSGIHEGWFGGSLSGLKERNDGHGEKRRSWLRMWGLGFRVWGFGFWVEFLGGFGSGV